VKVRFACTECGHETVRWEGRCAGCGAWNSFREWTEPVARAMPAAYTAATPVALDELVIDDDSRLSLGIPEFDRVLGGGVVPGSLVLIGGDPGIGKSTLVLQAAGSAAAKAPVLYVSAEESAAQVKMRAERLGLGDTKLLVLAETSLDAALRQADEIAPALLVVDSVQTVFSESAGTSAGSIAQLRECAGTLMRWAKASGIPVVLIGHVTKDGDIAGPRMLEHVVDVVLYLEGERFSSYRLLRAVKNRFGSIDEIGVFEMTGEGLRGVENPSEAFIAERAVEPVGSVVVPVMEGTRPVLVELQALTSPTATRTRLEPPDAGYGRSDAAAGRSVGRPGRDRQRRRWVACARARGRPRAGAGDLFIAPRRSAAAEARRPGRGRSFGRTAVRLAPGAAANGG